MMWMCCARVCWMQDPDGYWIEIIKRGGYDDEVCLCAGGGHVYVCLCVCRTLVLPVLPSSHVARTQTRAPRARTRPDTRAATLVGRSAECPRCRLMAFPVALVRLAPCFRRLLTCLCLARARAIDVKLCRRRPSGKTSRLRRVSLPWKLSSPLASCACLYSYRW